MPAADPDDQRAARDFEQTLRYYVLSGQTPQSKLDWFLTLPKQVRRSRRLINEALGPVEAAEMRVREQLGKRRARDFENMLRLKATRAQPRDLSCLRGDSKPWAGISRRKKRCRAFDSIGRTYLLRQTLAKPSAVHVLTLEREPEVSPRPVTPADLREAAWYLRLAVYGADGPGLFDFHSPAPPTPSPKPEKPIDPPVQRILLRPGELNIFGQEVDPHFAYIVALGRSALARTPLSLRSAAVDIVSAEAIIPGVLDQLAALLFPGGTHDFGSGVEAHAVVMDFCQGWYRLLS